MRLPARLASCAALLVPLGALAQPPDPAALKATQKEALKAFAFMDGTWRGPAWTLLPDGGKRHITQTERIGPFLDGTVKVIEGRGYLPDGRVGFNALGVISYHVAAKKYSMKSWALGHSGDFAIVPRADGYTWETPAGPGAVVRYTATIRGDTFREVGDRIVEGREPVRIFEMDLKRVGDTSWPAGDPVPMR
jgi:hypothetical protein